MLCHLTPVQWEERGKGVRKEENVKKEKRKEKKKRKGKKGKKERKKERQKSRSEKAGCLVNVYYGG